MVAYESLTHPVATYLVYPLIVILLTWLARRFYNSKQQVRASFTLAELKLPPSILSELEYLGRNVRNERMSWHTYFASKIDNMVRAFEAREAVTNELFGDGRDKPKRRDTLYDQCQSISDEMKQSAQSKDPLESDNYIWMAPFFRETAFTKWPSEVLYGSIINSGKSVANAVSIECRPAKHALIQRIGRDDVFAAVNGIIQLGSIQPHESISVQIWTGWGAAFGEDVRIVVRHDHGASVAGIRIPCSRKLVNVAQSLYDARWFCLVLFFILLVELLAIKLTTSVSTTVP